MHRAKIRIPQSKPQFDVCVIGLYRSKKDSGPFAYLQNFRHEWSKILGKDREETEKARTYKRKVDPEYVPMLVNAIEGPVDAVLSRSWTILSGPAPRRRRSSPNSKSTVWRRNAES